MSVQGIAAAVVSAMVVCAMVLGLQFAAGWRMKR